MPGLKELRKQIDDTKAQLREAEDAVLAQRRRTHELDAADTEASAASNARLGF